ncbi:hypothetical protein K438DRAFT_1763008 [Mycena galopus ATCC 62051]|nr:hypothetical protein K438DRAFT_1763008 [Mycena galopus ATCC 62051]
MPTATQTPSLPKKPHPERRRMGRLVDPESHCVHPDVRAHPVNNLKNGDADEAEQAVVRRKNNSDVHLLPTRRDPRRREAAETHEGRRYKHAAELAGIQIECTRSRQIRESAAGCFHITARVRLRGGGVGSVQSPHNVASPWRRAWRIRAGTHAKEHRPIRSSEKEGIILYRGTSEEGRAVERSGWTQAKAAWKNMRQQRRIASFDRTRSALSQHRNSPRPQCELVPRLHVEPGMHVEYPRWRGLDVAERCLTSPRIEDVLRIQQGGGGVVGVGAAGIIEIENHIRPTESTAQLAVVVESAKAKCGNGPGWARINVARARFAPAPSFFAAFLVCPRPGAFALALAMECKSTACQLQLSIEYGSYGLSRKQFHFGYTPN